jgi:hypothetical protein
MHGLGVTVVNGNTVFTFDTGDVLIVENIADPNLLRTAP